MGGIYEMKKPRRINSFSVTLFLIVATVGYLGYFYIPVWWPVFALTGIMRGICNDAYREHNNETLMTKLLTESKRTGLHLSRENFELVRVPYAEEELSRMGLNDAQRAAYQRRGKKCTLTLKYTARAQWPFLEKTAALNMGRSVESDLAQIKY